MARQWRDLPNTGWGSRQAPAMRTPNRPSEVLHNHNTSPVIVYEGFCKTAPQYHLFRCRQLSAPSRRTVELIPFDRTRFSDKDSKAGRGGCSMPTCLADAVMMNSKGQQAYCERHAERARPARQSCPWTSIFFCVEKAPVRQDCSLCQEATA